MDLGFRLKSGFLALSVALLFGCGGSGGGGDDSPSYSPVEYNGKTTPASIDDSNKDSIAASARKNVDFYIDTMEESDSASEIMGAGSSVKADLLSIIQATTSSFSSNAPTKQRVVSSTEYGTCGGSYSYTDSTITYSNYCVYGMTIDGKATVKQSSDGRSVEVVYRNFTIKADNFNYSLNGFYKSTSYGDGSFRNWYNLSVVVDGETFTMAGDSYCPADDDLSCVNSSYYKDGNTTYKAEIITDFSENSSDGTISGEIKLYHPDYGYVNVVVDKLKVCSSGTYESGTITITDNDGSKIVISYSSCGSDGVVSFTPAP